MPVKRSKFDTSGCSAAMLLCSKIVSSHGDTIAHQPRISLERMCDMSHLPGVLGIRKDDILPLSVGQTKSVPVEGGYTLVVRRVK